LFLVWLHALDLTDSFLSFFKHSAC